jgi:L-ascorbate metabolism protein UlaG (beta-lactamase superfamily)
VKPAFQRDDAFLADVRAREAHPEQLHLWWLGQSGFLVQHQRRYVLFDPYLSDSLTHKYAATDKPHTRMTERVVAPGRLGGIDLVTSTHVHTDHLDAETLEPLLRNNPRMDLLIPEANRAFVAERLQCNPEWPVGMEDGVWKRVGRFDCLGVPAAHESIERDEQGRCKHLGYVVRMGGWTVYHSGDTVRYDGMAELLAPHRVDVALLPINGRAPERRVAGNLWGREAAQLARDIGARVVIPCHFDMFTFNTATPDEFVSTCETLGQRYCVLQNGEHWSSAQLD